MLAADKIKYLRTVEGHLRGLNREMTQTEVVGAIKKELNGTISQPYLSLLEGGHRKHLTNKSRLLLARFFKVHPGYLVDDPEGYSTELLTDLSRQEDKLDLWLVAGAERFERDPQLARALLRLARHGDSRCCLLLLAEILETPDLVNRLWETLKPDGKREGRQHERV